MANTQAMCASFKAELANGFHQFGSPTIVSRGSLTVPTVDTFKAALYVATATINKGTTVYSGTNEVSGANYNAGGVTIGAWVAPAHDGTSAYTTPTANFLWTNVTLATSFDCCFIYNSTQTNRAVSVHTFGAQTVTAGNFTLNMPSNAVGTALLQIT